LLCAAPEKRFFVTFLETAYGFVK